MAIRIKKRNGDLVPLDVSKIKIVVHNACKGLNVSASELEVSCVFRFTDGMSTERIQEILIETAKNLITEETPDYSKVVARLINYDLRKRVYGAYQPPKFLDLVTKLTAMGVYDSYILDNYSLEEFEVVESYIDHERDNDFSLAAMGQLTGKYLLRDRTKKNGAPHFETPQMMYMAVACVLMAKYVDKFGIEGRLELIKDFYDGASTFKFSLPTPILGGVRTSTRQFSSCVVIDTDDSLPSINAVASTVVNYVSKRAGIGLNEGRIRAVGASIRKGEMEHTGVVPFLKYHVGALKSCSQGGIRGGSATAYYPLWHYQIEEILVLKNNRGVAENRERRCDYGIQIGDEMYERLLENKLIYLFDPNEVGPELYESYFYSSNDTFKRLYAECIQRAERGEIRFKTIKAADLFIKLIDERFEVGRIFIMNTQTVNKLSPFYESLIYLSNLCLEICVPTKPFESLEDKSGRIGLCTLASLNMSQFVEDEQQLEELPVYIRALVFALDSLLDYQDYPAVQAKESTLDWRTLGIGIVNLADFIMLNGGKYGDPHILQAVNKFMRRMNYFGRTASIELSELYGPCRRSYEITNDVRDLHDENFDLKTRFHLSDTDQHLKFNKLEDKENKSGRRHATLFAVAPTESSSQVLNATNGVEMPRGFISIKGSKDGQFGQVVPHPENKDDYDYIWNHASPEKYLETIAVIQRWVDQSISTNTSYNPSKFPDGKVPRQLVLDNLLYCWSLGLKTLYYNNIPDGASDELGDTNQSEPTPKDTDNDCDGVCVI